MADHPEVDPVEDRPEVGLPWVGVLPEAIRLVVEGDRQLPLVGLLSLPEGLL